MVTFGAIDWGDVPGWVAALFAICWALWERHQRSVAEAKQLVIEREMADQQRRANGPDLKANYISYKNSEFGNKHIMPGQKVPDELPDGTQLRLMLRNEGADIKRVSDDRPDGEGICRNIIQSGDNVEFTYHFRRPKLGMHEHVRIDYEGFDGVKAYHVYETIHGEPYFKRIEPN